MKVKVEFHWGLKCEDINLLTEFFDVLDTFDTEEERDPRHFASWIPSFVKLMEKRFDVVKQKNVNNNDKTLFYKSNIKSNDISDTLLQIYIFMKLYSLDFICLFLQSII